MQKSTKRLISMLAAVTLTFSGSSLPVSSMTGYIRGDLNGNYIIEVDDAQMALLAYTKQISGLSHGLTSYQFDAADVDWDGELTVTDAQFILLFYVNNTLLGKKITWEELISPPASAENLIPETGAQCSILCWTGDDVEKMIEHFTGAHPEYEGKIRYVNVGSFGGEAREQYASYFAGGNDADLYLVENDWALDYLNNSEYSAPISDLGFTESDFDGCFPYTISAGRDSNGTLKAVTWQATPGGYVYRSDLAKTYLGAATPEEMQSFVRDWDTFANTAKTVSEKSGGKTAMAATLGDLMQAWQYNRTSAWLDAYDQPIVDDFCTSFAEYAKNFYQKGYVTTEDQWSDGWYAIGQDDSTLGYFYCTWCLSKGSMLSNSEGGEGGKTYGKYNITEGPSGWWWGGSWLTLSPNCDNGTIAHDFIEHFVVNEDSMESFAKFKGEFVNNPTVMEKVSATHSNDLLGGQSEYPTLIHNAGAVKSAADPKPKDYIAKDCLRDAIRDYAKGYYGTNSAAMSGYCSQYGKNAQNYHEPDPDYIPDYPYNPSGSGDPETLRILCWTGDDVEKMIALFETNHPAYKGKVEYWNVGSSGGEAREMYANYFAGGEDADLYLLEQDWILDYINNNEYTMPLSELGFSDSDFSNCIPYTVPIGRDSNGVLKAVTFQSTPGGYVYRTDLAKQILGVTTPAEMQPYVKDWSTFTTTAATVSSATNGKTAMADTLYGMFNVWKCSNRVVNLTDDNAAYISNTGKSFAELARKYYVNGYVTKEDQWSDGWYRIGQDGSTMGYFFCSWCLGKGSMLSNAEGGEGGKTYGKYNITQGPGGWYWGGSWIAASGKCDSPAMAYDFLYDFTVNETTMKQYMMKTGDFVNNQKAVAAFNSTASYSNPLLGGQNQFPILLDNAANNTPSDIEYTPYDSQLEDAYYYAISRYVKGDFSSYADAEAFFKKQAARIEGITVLS